jgi:hypothetical protein
MSSIQFLTVRLETEPCRELETPGAEPGYHRQRRAKIGIRGRSPDTIRSIRSSLGYRVLHIVDRVLLEIRMIEKVEGLGHHFHGIAFADSENPRDTEIYVFHRRTSKRIESFAGHDREVHFRLIEHRRVRPATCQV